ncbi:MAG TPA: glycerate kinase [Planctomycetota bacterium]
MAIQNPRSKIQNVVVACATFKGTLSGREAGEAIARGLQRAGYASKVVALADGGEGLVEALASQVPGAARVSVPVRGPLLQPVTATAALLPVAPASAPAVAKLSFANGSTAVIEMAASSGLGLVPENRRDPKVTTTLGVGDQILRVLDAHPAVSALLLGLGGSATNDGGAGMAQALGVRLLDKNGHDLPPGGAALSKLARIDISRMDKRLATLPVTVACDVRNPLCGPQGASAIYGPQKGATPADVKLLDEALAHYADLIKRDLGKDVALVPGAGAAGGLGAGCLAFLNATLKPGIDLVLDTVNFDAALAGAALVITGEGRLDEQTLMGKAPAGVAARAKKAGVRCVAIGGGIEPGRENELRRVFASVESLTEFAGFVSAAMKEPAKYLEELASQRIADWLT